MPSSIRFLARRFVLPVAVAVAAAIVLVLIVVSLVAMENGSRADAGYRSIEYEAVATADGDLKVTQRIDYRLGERKDDDGNTKPYRQLYWQYTLDPDNLTNITDIAVTNLATGRAYTQTAPRNPDGVGETSWNTDYANHWYIADVTRSADDPQPYDPARDGLAVGDGAGDGRAGRKTVEIGWNIPVTTSADSMRFEVTYTMHDVATKYRDVTTFMWEPIGTTNQLPAGSVTGVVRFPDGVGKDDVRTWLHSDANGRIARTDDGAIRFSLTDVRVGRYVDVVAAYDAAYAGDVARTGDGDRLPALIADETARERKAADRERVDARIRLAVWAVTAALGALFAIWGLVAVIRTNRESRYNGSIDYWYDDPGVSPDSAARLIDIFDDIRAAGLDDRSLSATVLSLAAKKAIAIYPGSMDQYRGLDMSRADPAAVARILERGTRAERGQWNQSSKRDRWWNDDKESTRKADSTIVILPAGLALKWSPEREALGLCRSESACLDLLVDISRRVGGPVFDFRRMRLACKDWTSGYQSMNRFRRAARKEYEELGATRRTAARYVVPSILAIAVGVGSIIHNAIVGNPAMMLCVGAPAFAIGLFCAMAGAPEVPTAAGQEYYGRCIGLKRYLEDFSDLADRTAPDYARWDRYLVYAAAFGISRRVVTQFARAFPQLADPGWLDGHGAGSLWYWTYRPYAYRYAYDHDYDYGPSVGAGALVGAGASEASGGGRDGFAFGGDAFASGIGDIGSQISAGFASVSSAISAAAPSSSGGSYGGGGGGFDGGGGGSGGGGGGAR